MTRKSIHQLLEIVYSSFSKYSNDSIFDGCGLFSAHSLSFPSISFSYNGRINFSCFFSKTFPHKWFLASQIAFKSKVCKPFQTTTRLTPDHIYDCQDILAAIFRLRALPLRALHSLPALGGSHWNCF